MTALRVLGVPVRVLDARPAAHASPPALASPSVAAADVAGSVGTREPPAVPGAVTGRRWTPAAGGSPVNDERPGRAPGPLPDRGKEPLMPDGNSVTNGAPAIAAMDSLTGEQREYVRGLRELATFIECNPVRPKGDRGIAAHIYVGYDRAQFEALAAALGAGEPEVDEHGFVLATRAFGPHRLVVQGWASSCGFTKVEVEETVTVSRWVREPAVEATVLP